MRGSSGHNLPAVIRSFTIAMMFPKLAAPRLAKLLLVVLFGLVPTDLLFALQVNGEHLYQNGQQVRLWGVHVSAGMSAPAYADSERIVAQLTELGFNAVAVWGTEKMFAHGVPASRKGDGSAMDRMDYFIHSCRKAGMVLWLAAAARLPLADESVFVPGAVPNLDIQGWMQEMRALESAPRKEWLRKHALYLDPNLQALKLRFLKQLLTHVNPYSGHDYASDEGIMLYLDDETHFISRASSVNQGYQEWPPYMKRLLEWRLGSHSDGHKGVFEIAEDWVDRLLAETKAVAPKLLLNTTTTGKPSIQDILLSCRGDFCAHGGGGASAGEPDLQAPPRFGKGPHSREFKVAGKPWIMYTAHAFKHSPERIYWPVALAAFASYQDADGVFFWFWGSDPQAESKNVHGKQDRFDLASDPAIHGQLRLASLLFRNHYLPSAEVNYKVRIGPAALGDGRFGGQWRHQESYKHASEVVLKTGVRLLYDSQQTEPVRLPRLPFTPLKSPHVWQDGDQNRRVVWDWENGRLFIDTPEAKALLGSLDAAHVFADEVKVSVPDGAKMAFVIASADGLPLQQSRLIYANASAALPGKDVSGSRLPPLSDHNHTVIELPLSGRHVSHPGGAAIDAAAESPAAEKIVVPLDTGDAPGVVIIQDRPGV